MTKKIKTDVRFKSTAQLEKQVAKELSLPDPKTPIVFSSGDGLWGSDNFKDKNEEEDES
jgi:hypothetical protein|tara:strand:- start:238 stop:414 length:177 start_codon:yes stop_codon:yes gene_type:complete